jgi:very-short-patch-repair endonuclease
MPPAPPAETAKTHLEDAFLRSRDDDRRLGELAERQYGLVERGQLDRLGVGRGAVLARLKAGRLHRVYGGVYSVGHRVLNRQGRWMAGVLASGPDAVLSHWSAAALWMIRPNSRTIIDVTCPHKSRTWSGITRHHKALPADEVTAMDGIPVTSVPRTILDLAATTSTDDVENLIREMEFLELRDRLSLWHLIGRYPGRRGVRKVRVALERIKDEPVGRKKSRLEERFAPFLRQHRLPLPRFNDWIFLGAKRFQVDCHWPDLRQIVELDGWQGHSTRTAFREDRHRDRVLGVHDYHVTHLTWNQLEDEPGEIASDLRVLLQIDR